jgi:hypothetical protein
LSWVFCLYILLQEFQNVFREFVFRYH